MANSYAENDDFFDAPEDITTESDSEASEDGNPELQLDNNTLESLHSNFWAGHPNKSVDERRDEFIRQTGFDLERCLTARGELHDPICDHNGNEIDIDRRKSTSRLGSRKGKNIAGEATNDGEDILQVNHGVMSKRFRGLGIKRCATTQDAETIMSSQHSRQHSMKGEREVQSDVEGMRKIRCRTDWFKKFGVKASNMFSRRRANKNPCNYCTVFGPESERIRVRSHKKWSKELSSLYRIQDFSAHKGSILSMKFSHDGQHLATGGEDGILYIWKVTEDERPPSSDILSFDSASACLYFSVNGISDFASFLKIKEEKNMIARLKNSLHSACIMLPRKVFHIIEKPVHELCGHEGEILDISWSKEGYLLTSSDDKTVRLWQLGCDRCLRVFPHNDYVTCAQFNPLNNNQFISGSIDGIVRLWEVHGCRVADWVDFKEIMTAICYRLDGKGGIVGSMAGSCSFFEIADDCPRGHIIDMQGKQKLAGKRITGFQFSPTDPSVVLVSSADSQVRVLRGAALLCKLRGTLSDIKDGGTSMTASFTSDGKHIIAATDNSVVYMWNHPGNERIPNTKVKTIWTCESFSSPNALIALPWQGFKSTPSPESSEASSMAKSYSKTSQNTQYFDENGVQESSAMGSETHSREGVPQMSPTVVLPIVGKIDYELLKVVCESILTGAHMLGLVIVTGGKDGRIKIFHNYGLPIRSSRGKSSLKNSWLK